MTAKQLSPFNWRSQPSQINWRDDKSRRQMLLDATRVNKEASACTFVPPEHSQRIRKAKI